MFVVKTIQQLEKAIRVNAKEVIIVGRHAPEILAAIHRSAFNDGDSPLHPSFSRLKESFDMLEVIENRQKVAAILHQKSKSSQMIKSCP